MRPLYLLAAGYLGVVSFALLRGPRPAPVMDRVATVVTTGTDGRQWFARVRGSCNAVEVEMAHRRFRPPRSLEGASYSAACWALAGRVDRARAVIDSLDGDDRWRAAGVVFDVAHPVADMGDDRSAGPIMELVVDYWPNHYMALYHAGAARFGTHDYDRAARHLTAFLEHYQYDDGWTRSARSMLDGMERP